MAVASPTRIQLCGALAATIDGSDIIQTLPGAQGRVAFAYLICNRTREVTRAELADALWGETLPPESGTALRALISKLRRALNSTGSECLPGGDLLRVRLPIDAWVDLEAATQALHDAQAAVAQQQDVRAWIAAHIALNISAREFLAGHSYDWVAEQRALLSDMQLLALEALAACSLGLGAGEVATAVRASRRLVSLAPLRETGYGLLMRALAQQGNTAEALLTYEQLRVVLREQLGAIPATELQALHASLLTSP